MIKRGDTVHHVTDGGSIRTGTAENDEAWGQCSVSFPGYGSQTVSAMSLFHSAAAAHRAAMGKKSTKAQ